MKTKKRASKMKRTPTINMTLEIKITTKHEEDLKNGDNLDR